MINYLAQEKASHKKQDPIFCIKNGAISGNRIQKMLKEYATKAGICERITPHVLRHSFATEMYHQKVPLSAADLE